MGCGTSSLSHKDGHVHPDVNNKTRIAKTTAAFKSIHRHSKPINYSSSTISDETYAFLLSMEKENEMAKKLAELYYPGKSFSIIGLDEEHVEKLINEYATLCEYTLDQMCGAQDFVNRVKWQTAFLHLIQATYRSQFGDFSFSKIKEKADALRKKYPIGSDKKNLNLEGLNEIDYPEGIKDAKLPDYLDFLHDDKYKITLVDTEYIARKGEVSVPSEIAAAADACSYVQTIQASFSKDMKNIFKRSKQFKSNAKGLARAIFKMDEYAEKKPRPSFNYIWDLIRCKAIYKNIQSLREDFKTLVASYKVIQVKDKLQTALKNLTINIVYDKIIAEVQMVYGDVPGEYSNHKIYEVYRCETIEELHRTILAWSDYRFEEFKPLSGTIFPTKNLESQTFRGVNGFGASGKYSIMKSKEYGIFTNEPVFLCEDDIALMCGFPIDRLKCHYDTDNIYAISLQGIEQLRAGVETVNRILTVQDSIINVTGAYSRETGIKRLELYLKSGTKLTIGSSVPDEVTFDVKIPKHCVVLGFGYRANEESGMQSIYCWFGPPSFGPLDGSKEEIEKILESLNRYVGLPHKCPQCTRQMLWYSDKNMDFTCKKCNHKIVPKTGVALCHKDSYALCSACLYKEHPDIPSLPNLKEILCDEESHELEWQYYRGENETFSCKKCKKKFGQITGSYTCPCDVHLCNECYNKQCKIARLTPLSIFPIIITDFNCGKCHRSLLWYWHTRLCGYPMAEYSCNICECRYPPSSGSFHCDKCEYDVCSKCYYDSGRSDVSTLPNFRNKTCSKGKYLTWQFDLNKPWNCNTCETEFSGGSGCYVCPLNTCDGFKECAGCYLRGVLPFDYTSFKLKYINDVIVAVITPFGRYNGNMDCFTCGRDLIWLWDRLWGCFPSDEEQNTKMDSYICNIHKGTVSVKAGSFYCLNCDYDVCSMCYKEEKKTNLLIPPNISKKTCPTKDTLLTFSYDLPKGWTCILCKTIFEDPLAGYTCSPNGSPSCCTYYVCPTCFVNNNCKFDMKKYEENVLLAREYYDLAEQLNNTAIHDAKKKNLKVAKTEGAHCECGGQIKFFIDDTKFPGFFRPFRCRVCQRKVTHYNNFYYCFSCDSGTCNDCFKSPFSTIFTQKNKSQKICGLKKWKLHYLHEIILFCDICTTKIPDDTGYYACENFAFCSCGYVKCEACHKNKK